MGERRKKEEALKADAKLKADAAKFLEEQEKAKKIQKETVTVRAGAGAKVDMFEKGDEGKEKVKVSEEMFMTEEQIAEKKRKFEEEMKKKKEEEEARMKLDAEGEEARKKREEAAAAEAERQ